MNLGLGHTSSSGSSGAGHGGTSGRGSGTDLTGQPYGDLYQPYIFGSGGGGGSGNGGRGGGMIWLNVTNLIQIDGELRSDGTDARSTTGGGGSGGSIWMYCHQIKGMGNVTARGGNQFPGGSGGGAAGGRIAIYFNINQTYLGTYQSHGGDAANNGEPGGPGTVFLYHQQNNHSTLYLNNLGRVSTHVQTIRNYTDITRDSFKAWILPDSGRHWLALGDHDYRFDELQIYGNAHLAILPQPVEHGANLHFRYMIGDKTGIVHVGPYQVMDLRRLFIDTPFSSYVYDGGFLGLAPDTNLEKVFVHLEGTLDHVVNLTLIAGGELRLFLTGSTNRRTRLNYHINGTTTIKARSSINCSSPLAHNEHYNLVYNTLVVEGGGAIRGTFMHINATDLTVDDGGDIDVSGTGYPAGMGQGE